MVAGERDAARERFAELVASQQRRAAPHRLSLPARCARRGRGGAGRVRQGVHAHHDLPRAHAVRSVVHPHSRQRMPRHPESPRPAAALGPARCRSRPSCRRWNRSRPGQRRGRVWCPSERALEIATAVDRLPDRQRTVFTLCHIAEQSTAEIGRALGFSEATVRVHLFRAVRKLRQAAARRKRRCAWRAGLMKHTHLTDDQLIAAVRRTVPATASR